MRTDPARSVQGAPTALAMVAGLVANGNQTAITFRKDRSGWETA